MATTDLQVGCHLPVYGPAATRDVLLGFARRMKALVLPHRHPVLAAKMLATLDHLAPGRVILGAGVGWMKEEIAAPGATRRSGS